MLGALESIRHWRDGCKMGKEAGWAGNQAVDKGFVGREVQRTWHQGASEIRLESSTQWEDVVDGKAQKFKAYSNSTKQRILLLDTFLRDRGL